MKYIPGIPSKEQMYYIKQVQKLDPSIDATSIVIKVPDYGVLEKEYTVELNKARNNFERTKINREFELKKVVWRNLVQIQFKVIGYEFPFYFETVPMPITNGVLLDNTLNTVVNLRISPIFFGKVAIEKLSYLFVSPDIKADPTIFGEYFDLNDFKFHGKFESGTLLSVLRHDLGEKILKTEVSKKELFSNDLIAQLNNDGVLQKNLQKFFYLSHRKIRPVDSPESIVSIGYIAAECIGCVIPVTEDYMLIQIGDFHYIHKSRAYPLLKQLLHVLLQPS
jgi:hypothetical protein